MSVTAEAPPAMNRMRRGIVFSVTFVRHGETQANKEQKIQGHRDIPLSSIGEMQATQAGQRLKETLYTRAYASDLSRAHTTCQIILRHNSKPPAIVIDTGLRERNFGSVEGVHIDVAKNQAAAEGLNWGQWNPPGAETLGDLQARMVKFFKELCQSVYDKNKDNISNGTEAKEEEEETLGETNGVEKLEKLSEEDSSGVVESVLVVGHGAALKQLYTHLHSTLGCAIPPSHPLPHPLTAISPNTGISEYLIRYSPKKYDVHCVRLHDGCHLQES